MLWTILAIIAAVIAALFIFAARRPDAFRVERSVRISAPPERVFPLIADFQAFNTWNPFAKSDATTSMTYSGAKKWRWGCV